VKTGELRQRLADDRALRWHLQFNHYPPIDEAFVATAKRAIELGNAGQWDREIETPRGDVKTARQIVEDLRLQEFIDDEEPPPGEPHTPGPWHVDRNQICNADGWALASVPYTTGGAQDRANARLMAAAPELLDALRVIVKRCGELAAVVPEQAGLIDAMASDARALIGKVASGEV